MTTKYEKKTNEKFLENLMKISKMWVWSDEQESYDILQPQLGFKTRFYAPKTRNGYNKLESIVSKKWADKYIFYEDCSENDEGVRDSMGGAQYDFVFGMCVGSDTEDACAGDEDTT